MMVEENYRKIASYLAGLSPKRKAPEDLGMDTEIYKDLGLYGDDIYEFLLWIKREFGVEIMVSFGKYVPTESTFFPIREALRRLRGDEYNSFKIRDIVGAIDEGGRKFD